MRCVGGASRVVQQPRLARCERVLHTHPRNCLIGQIAVEYVVRVAQIRLDRRGILVQRRVPLVTVAPNEPVEVFKAQSGRPQVERPRLARHPVRHIMHFAESCRVVAVVLEDCTDGTSALGHQRIVTRVACCEFGDNATSNRMVVSSADQRRPGRRAKRRRVIFVVAKAAIGKPLEVRRLDRPAEGAARTKSYIIGQDQ
jgi:hypothetical protein